MAEPHVVEISGKVTLSDGTTSEFSVTKDLGWQQWGGTQARLGETVDLMDSLAEAANEHMQEHPEQDNEEMSE